MNSNIWLRSARVLVGALFIPFSWQLIGIPAAWLLFGYPIGRLMIVSVEDRFLSPSPHPVVIHFIHLTSGVYFGTRIIGLMSFYYACFYYDHGENETAYMLIISLNSILIVCMYIFLLCYGIYFNTNIEKIVAKYDKEFNKERMDNNEEYDHISNSYQIMNNNIWLRYALIFFVLLFIPVGWQLIGIAVAWLLFGYPIGRLWFVSHQVEDRLLSPSTHPVVIHFIHLTSGVYFGTRIIGLISLISLNHDHEENVTAGPKLTTVAGFTLAGYMHIFLLCYILYFNINIEKIVAKYDKQFNKERRGKTTNSNMLLRSAGFIFGAFFILFGSIFIPFSWQMYGIPVAWLLFGYPIGRLLIVSVEDRFLSPSPHPVVVHFIHLTSGVYFVTRFICFMLVYYAVFYYYHGENDTAYMLILGVHFIIIGCMYIFLLCYGLYFNLNIEEIVAKYDKEFNKERMDNNKEYDHNHEMEKLELL